MATQTGGPPLTLLYRKKIQAGGRWTTRHPFSITYEAVKNRPAQTWLLEIFTPFHESCERSARLKDPVHPRTALFDPPSA